MEHELAIDREVARPATGVLFHRCALVVLCFRQRYMDEVSSRSGSSTPDACNPDHGRGTNGCAQRHSAARRGCGPLRLWRTQGTGLGLNHFTRLKLSKLNEPLGQ